MFGKKKIHKYNSRNYDLANTNDFEEFYSLIDTLNDFDFAISNKKIVYGELFTWANIHVETNQEMMEIWLVKHQFVEA